jgi:hypothetical protein
MASREQLGNREAKHPPAHRELRRYQRAIVRDGSEHVGSRSFSTGLRRPQ